MGFRCVLLACLLALWAGIAYAQPAPEVPTPGSPGAGGSAAEPGEGEQPSSAAGSTKAEEYQRHLDNGVKLFSDNNYRGAITEFEAAYRAEPKASPLINIALSYKALHDYPKAIAALDRAITHHADSIQPAHLDAAKREITQLRQLLGYVTVRLQPPQAVLLIDGEVQPAAAVRKPIPLSPGPHKLQGRLAGYRTVEQQLTLTAGEHKKDVTLTLTASGGQVKVVLRDRDTWVQVGNLPPSQGGWNGTVAAGVQLVTVFKHGDSQRRTIQILVNAGESLVVTENEEGQLESAAEVPQVPTGEEDPEGERQGFYFLGHGVLLGMLPQPKDFTTEKAAGGLGVGARIGYRVADWAAFEGLGQLSLLGAREGVLKEERNRLPGTLSGVEYSLYSMRLGGGFRVMAPGRSWARFVGIGSGGISLDNLSWDGCNVWVADEPSTLSQSVTTCPYQDMDGVGVGGFGQLELGVEFEFSNVLLDALIQNTLQSTRGFAVGEADPWDGTPLLLVGLSVHVGYGIW